MKYSVIILLTLTLYSCENKINLLEPEYTDGSILTGTTKIPDQIKNDLEGIYKITKGADKFGSQVAFKWHGDKLVVYGSKSGTYFSIDSGVKDTSFLFEGKWRLMRNTDVGLLRLKIGIDEGVLNLWNNNVSSESIKLVGSFGIESNPNNKDLELKYLRPFSDEAINSKFLIIGHRGGVRNSDYIGISENSIEMISKAEILGSNAIEIDVKLSKDNIPFLYHDSDINLRLTQEAPIWGPIEDFTFPQIRTFITLTNGERIPSLEEALEFVLTKTKLRFVWLDMKSSKNAMPVVIPLQQEIMNRAKEMGRDLAVAVGLPSEDKQKLFMQYPGYENIDSINELEIQNVRESNSSVWGPRWTMGSQTEAVRQMHDEGRLAITWTVDQDEFIKQFIYESEFDGFVTNYPTVVAYYNYAR
ncbi:MAG: glycerophosphodiester phosphodiesterase [Bacteroidota bacterium]